MKWTNLEIAQDEISKIESKFSKQLSNPNVSIEFPELYTKSGELKKRITASDLKSIRETPAKDRLYYTYKDTGEIVPYSEYQRRMNVLKIAESQARKSLTKASIDLTIIDNFLNPINWAHYTPGLGDKVSNWLSRMRSKYDNDIRKIAKGLELAAKYDVLKDVQQYSYEHNIESAYLPKLIPFLDMAGVQVDDEDKAQAQAISEEFEDITATSGIPEELLRQIQESDEFEEEFD